MSQAIAKGAMFSVLVEVNDARLAAMKAAPELANQAMQVGANYWHTGILPQHFKAGAGAVYGYAPRSPKYLKNRNKGGKPALVFSGSLRRELLARASFVEQAKGAVTLKMYARALNLAPSMPQNSDDLYVKHKGGRGYPNMKREVKAITADEREAVAVVVTADLEKSFNPAPTP